MTTLTASFLSEFPPIRTEQWENLIRENAAGPEYSSRMIWHAEEGLAVKPYYRSDDLAGLPFLNAAPGEFPYVRGTRCTGDWRIREVVDASDPEEANRIARDAVKAGAEEIEFSRTRIDNSSDLALILSGLNGIPIYLKGVTAHTIPLLMERLNERPHTRVIATDLDPLADLGFSAQVISGLPDGLVPFAIRADEFHESGAGAIEELGFPLSRAVDFVAEMRDRGIVLKQILRSVGFSFVIGPEIFIQVAKLRAFRMIWAQVVKAFGGSLEDAKATIYAETAHWNQTVYDPYVNALRGTTEAISAILGGADSITIIPFDACYRLPNQSSRRLARNTQIILKQEALFSRVADPLGGSYLIEALTNAIAAKAWRLLQDLEAAGGFRKAKSDGIVDSVLDQRRRVREQAVACRRVALTGCNRFPNLSEAVLDRVDPIRISAHQRAAEPFETMRVRTEQHVKSAGHAPRIVLAEIGDPKMRAARSQFASEFLACAGLSGQKQRFERSNQIASAHADLLVLCSSDPEYLGIAVELMPKLQERVHCAKVVIAGNPESAEKLRALGISDFIHMRSNAVEVLSAIQKKIGIEG